MDEDLPKAVQTCQDMTRPPRMSVGEFSAEKTGTVTSLRPIPMPRSMRQAASWPQVCETAMPKGARREKMAATKMTPRRPMRSLRGSEIQPALGFRVRRGSEDCRSLVRELRCCLQNPDGDVRHRVHETDDPAVVLAPLLPADTRVARVGNAHGGGEREVGAVGAGLSRAVSPTVSLYHFSWGRGPLRWRGTHLVPPLDSSGNRV